MLSDEQLNKEYEELLKQKSFFGIPTHLLFPGRYHSEMPESTNPHYRFDVYSRIFSSEFMNFLVGDNPEMQAKQRAEALMYDARRHLHQPIAYMARTHALQGLEFTNPMAVRYPHDFESGTDHPHLRGRSKFVEPEFGVVVLGTQKVDMDEYIRIILELKNQQKEKFLGHPLQWQYMDAMHEISHLTGAWEPQAEKMAAIKTAQTFEDSSFLHQRADWRAFRAISGAAHLLKPDLFKNDELMHDMTMALVNDAVAGMSRSEITAYTEDQIKDIRFETYPDLRKATMNVGRRISEIDPKALENNDFAALAEAATKLYVSNAFKTYEERMVNLRFLIAMLRLEHGAPAYDPEDQLVQADILIERLNEDASLYAPVFQPTRYEPEFPQLS